MHRDHDVILRASYSKATYLPLMLSQQKIYAECDIQINELDHDKVTLMMFPTNDQTLTWSFEYETEHLILYEDARLGVGKVSFGDMVGTRVYLSGNFQIERDRLIFCNIRYLGRKK